MGEPGGVRGKVGFLQQGATSLADGSRQLADGVQSLVDQVKSGGGSDGTQPHVSTSDTSFLNGADPRLTAPLMTGFNSSVVTIYWLGFGVMVLAFAITCFYRVPPLRTRSALEEKNELAQAAQEGAVA